MKIAFLAQSYPPMISGAAIFAKRIAEGMAERGHQVLVVAASDRGAPCLAQDQNLSALRLRSFHNPMRVGQRFILPARRAVLRALADFQPDLLHTHDPLQLGLSGITYSRAARVPIVLSIHQLPWFAASYIPDVDQLRARVESLLWNYARWLLRKFSALVAPTRTIAETVADKTGLPPSVISYGLDLRVFTPSPLSLDFDLSLRHRLGLPPRVPILLHVGRLDTDKRVDRVLRAAAETIRETGAYLLLVGDGREKSALMNLSKSLGIARRVRFPGFVTVDQGLPEIYRLARLFVTASEIETQGIVLLEAAASELPIAAVRATCIPEIVHHGENGFLAEPGDIEGLAQSMTTLLQNPLLAKRMGQASLRLAQFHDQQITMDAHEQLYRELIAAETLCLPKEIFISALHGT